MNNKRADYLKGFRDGLPIGLGYLSISFGFGITAVSKGLEALYAILISMTNLTSAGQVAGLGVIVAGGTFIEIALTQLIINLRYSLMGIALSQKLSKGFGSLHRLLSSFFITDEVFAVAMLRGMPVTPSYMYGLSTLPYIGWALGTTLGAFAGDILPGSLTTALGIAIYGMFIAIVVPPSKKDKGVLLTVILAIVLNCIICYAPVFSGISGGFAIIICAVTASVIAAIVKPVEEGYDE